MRVGEVELEFFSLGDAGAPSLVFLHDLDYLNGTEHHFLKQLAKRWRVLAPSHPGFGGSSITEGIDEVEDVAYVYLDWLRQTGPVHLVGAGFGGWIAAEMAVRCTRHLMSLTLVDAVGIKVGDRNTSDIKDLFVLDAQDLIELTWHDPSAGERLMPLARAGAGFDEDTLTQLLTNRRTAALMGWNPFMHHPKLRSRLHRIDVPTLVIWGVSDRLVTPEYGRAYADAIPGAKFFVLEGAGHYPYLERPDEFIARVEDFLRR